MIKSSRRRRIMKWFYWGAYSRGSCLLVLEVNLIVNVRGYLRLKSSPYLVRRSLWISFWAAQSWAWLRAERRCEDWLLIYIVFHVIWLINESTVAHRPISHLAITHLRPLLVAQPWKSHHVQLFDIKEQLHLLLWSASLRERLRGIHCLVWLEFVLNLFKGESEEALEARVLTLCLLLRTLLVLTVSALAIILW